MARRARPPRKTDGHRSKYRPFRGGRWTDISTERWALVVLTPSLIIGVPLALLAYGVAINLGYDPRRFLRLAATYALAPGGIGVVLLGLIRGVLHDLKAKQLAALEIDSDANAKLLRSRAIQLIRLIARLRRDQRRSMDDLRKDVTDHIDRAIADAVKQLKAAPPAPKRTWTGPMPATPVPSAVVAPLAPTSLRRDEEEDYTPSRGAPEIRIAPAASTAPPAEPEPPHIIPVSAHVTGAQALSQPASTRAPSTTPGERKLTPLDPEWMDEALSDDPPASASLWGRSGPISSALERFNNGETDTYPAADIDQILGKQRPFSSEEEE